MLVLLAIFFTISLTTESLCSEAMATTLSSTGFTLFTLAIHRQNLTTNSITRLTYLILAPPDNTLINRPLDANSVCGHVSNAGAFLYQSLLSMTPFSLLAETVKGFLIVGRDGERVSFNDVLFVVPNLYIDGSCSAHGVDGPLVPIPASSLSSVDDIDFPKPRIQTEPSHVSTRRRVGGTFKESVRFIRQEIA